MRTIYIATVSQITARMAFEALGFAPGTARLQLVQPNEFARDRLRGVSAGTVIFVLEDVCRSHLSPEKLDNFREVQRVWVEYDRFQVCTISLDLLLTARGP